MTTHSADPLFSGKSELRYGHPWLGALLASIDAQLRLRGGVYEYTSCPDCIFRMQIAANLHDLVLRDGTRLRPGTLVINLHMWNEQVPPMPRSGPTIAWARRMMRALDISLEELAWHLARRPDLADVAAIFANLTLASAPRDAQVVHIMQRYGFEAVQTLGPCSLRERMHRVGENILISLMVLAYNAAAFRAESLRRGRVLMCLSTKVLQERYGTRR